MRWLCCLLFLLACSAPPTPPEPTPSPRPADVKGYETTAFGMKPLEVKAALGWPVAPCKDRPEEWCVENFDVAGHQGRLRFFFDQNGLREVVLTAPSAAHAELLARHTDRYGPPDAPGVWTFPSCRIELTPDARLTYSKMPAP